MAPRKKRVSDAFNPIDVHVGKRVRMLRNLIGMSQTELGDALGISFQQLQKCEKGANRIGSSRLFAIGQELEVPVSFFFDEMPEDIAGRRNTSAGPTELDILNAEGAEDVARTYYAIEDEAVRKALFRMVKAMARSGKGRGESADIARRMTG